MELLAAFSIDVENLMLSSNCYLVLILTCVVLEDVAQVKAMHLSRENKMATFVKELLLPFSMWTPMRQRRF